MSNKVPPHLNLGQQQQQQQQQQQAELIAMLSYRPYQNTDTSKRPQLEFYFQINVRNYPEIPEGANLLDFFIIKNCKVTIKLDPCIHWRWSRQYSPITGKKDYREVYYCLTRCKDEKSISFYANYNKDCSLHDDDVHHLNLNIEYQQGVDQNDNSVWLPITIDPDVGNPRPPEQTFTENIVPEQGPFLIKLRGTIEEA